MSSYLRFDIYSFGFETEEDETGMLQSTRLINQLITAEVDAGVDANRIVLGGFSQGATMSLLTGLTGERKLAGIAALSGWIPLRNKFKSVSRVRLNSRKFLPLTEFISNPDGITACCIYSCFLGPRGNGPPCETPKRERIS